MQNGFYLESYKSAQPFNIPCLQLQSIIAPQEGSGFTLELTHHVLATVGEWTLMTPYQSIVLTWAIDNHLIRTPIQTV